MTNDVFSDLTSSVAKTDSPSPYHFRAVAPSPRDVPQNPVIPTTAAVAEPAQTMTFSHPSGGQEPADVRTFEMPTPTATPSDLFPPPPTAPEPQPTPPPKDPLHSALNCFRDEKPVEAVKHLEAFPPAQRELLKVLLPMVARVADCEHPSLSVAEISATLDRMARSLRVRSGLLVEKLCYVRSVEGFGTYEPVPANHVFQPGSAGRPGDLVQLYAELKNFVCACHGSEYETALACTLVIRDAKNNIVWEQGRPVQIERSRSARQDCFLRCNFYVPPGLPVGDYTLWLVVKDVTGTSREEASALRTAKRSLAFCVRAQSVVQNP